MKSLFKLPLYLLLFAFMVTSCEGDDNNSDNYQIDIPDGSIGIYSQSDLLKIGVDSEYPLDGSYVQGCNITLSGEWTPIGSGSLTSSTDAFKGTYDGSGFSISGLEINSSDSRVGLFGCTYNATIKNVVISNPSISSSSTYVGTVVGSAYYTTIIENCSVKGGSISGEEMVGGIAGYTRGSCIISCSSSATVSGDSEIGGVVGVLDMAFASKCSNSGNVSGTEYVGGVIGYHERGSFSSGLSSDYTASIEGCYNTGTVSGESYVGGVVGSNCGYDITGCYNTGKVSGTGTYIGGIIGGLSCYTSSTSYYTYKSTMFKCYNTGKVDGGSSGCEVGGLAGKNNASIISSCYNNGEISGYEYVGGVVGNSNGSTVISCYNAAKVTGTTSVGGLAGRTAATASSSIAATGSGSTAYLLYSYNVGAVYGSSNVGYFAGVNDSSTTHTSYITACGFIDQIGDDAENIVGADSGNTYSNVYASTLYDLTVQFTAINEYSSSFGESNDIDVLEFTAGTGSTLPSLMGESIAYN